MEEFIINSRRICLGFSAQQNTKKMKNKGQMVIYHHRKEKEVSCTHHIFQP